MFDFFRSVPKKRVVKIRSRSGIIYKNLRIEKKIIFHFANLIFVTAIAYLFYLYFPIGMAFSKYYLVKVGLNAPVSESEQIKKVEVKPGEFYINVPKIMATAKIIPNVSPFNEKEYLEILKNNVVAQAKGTNMPGSGKGKMTYIFAHSSEQGAAMARKNAVFYLLGELINNDPIFVNYEGKIYQYKVYDRKVISSKDVEYLKYSDPNKEVLILQTCWPIGTDWKRLIIFAELVK